MNLEQIVDMVNNKQEIISDKFNLNDMTIDFEPKSCTDIISIHLESVQPQVKNFNQKNKTSLVSPLFFKWDCDYTRNDNVLSDLFSFNDK